MESGGRRIGEFLVIAGILSVPISIQEGVADTKFDPAVPPRLWQGQNVTVDAIQIMNDLVNHSLSLNLPGATWNATLDEAPFVLQGALQAEHALSGDTITSMAPTPVYRGRIDGDNASLVRAIIVGWGFSLSWRHQGLLYALVASDTNVQPSHEAQYVLSKFTVDQGVENCDIQPPQESRSIYGDADFTFFDHGRNTVRDREKEVINGVATIWEAEVCISLTVAGTSWWNCEGCPGEGSNDVVVLLDAFTNHWEEEHEFVDRSAVFAMVGKPLDNGAAGRGWIGGCCHPQSDLSYALYAARLPYAADTFWNTVGPAHEIGHVWNGVHKDSINWEPDASPPRQDCPEGGAIHCTILSAGYRGDLGLQDATYTTQNRLNIQLWNENH